MSLASRRLFWAWIPYALGGTPGNFWCNSSQAKRAALLDYKREPSDKSLPALWRARNNAQRIARRLANDYWLNLCQNIQVSADCGHIRAMHVGLKISLFTGTATPQKEDYQISFRPKRHPPAPLKSAAGDIIRDRSKLMKRWAEHYQEFYSRGNIVTNRAIDSTSLLPVMNKLDVPPSV